MQQGVPRDAAAAFARLDGDREFLGELAVMFLEESQWLVVQIQEAVAANDQAGSIAPAPCLKNWTGTFVAPGAFEAVANVEAMGRVNTHATAGTALAVLEREIERLGKAMAQLNPEPAPLDEEGSFCRRAR